MSHYFPPGYNAIGSCSLCGGPVLVPVVWHGIVPPIPSCGQCGATAAASYGPVIPMSPAPGVRLTGVRYPIPGSTGDWQPPGPAQVSVMPYSQPLVAIGATPEPEPDIYAEVARSMGLHSVEEHLAANPGVSARDIMSCPYGKTAVVEGVFLPNDGQPNCNSDVFSPEMQEQLRAASEKLGRRGILVDKAKIDELLTKYPKEPGNG